VDRQEMERYEMERERKAKEKKERHELERPSRILTRRPAFRKLDIKLDAVIKSPNLREEDSAKLSPEVHAATPGGSPICSPVLPPFSPVDKLLKSPVKSPFSPMQIDEETGQSTMLVPVGNTKPGEVGYYATSVDAPQWQYWSFDYERGWNLVADNLTPRRYKGLEKPPEEEDLSKKVYKSIGGKNNLPLDEVDLDYCNEHDRNNFLIHSVENGCVEHVKTFLARGVDPNAQNKQGFTALHYACYETSLSVEIIKILLTHQADPNSVDKLGCTPLHYAASAGSVPAIALLLFQKARCGVVDSTGCTALDYARHGGFDDCVHLLENNSVNQLLEENKTLAQKVLQERYDPLIKKGQPVVFCKIHPMSKSEREMGYESVVSHTENTITVNSNKSHTFDAIFGPEAQSSTILEEATPFLNAAASGQNVLVVSYGGSSSDTMSAFLKETNATLEQDKIYRKDTLTILDLPDNDPDTAAFEDAIKSLARKKTPNPQEFTKALDFGGIILIILHLSQADYSIQQTEKSIKLADRAKKLRTKKN